MSERLRITREDISRAERERVKGHLEKAIDIVYLPFISFSMGNFSKLKEEEKTTLIKGARILFSANNSLARRQNQASQVERYLSDAREVVLYTYRNKDVSERAKERIPNKPHFSAEFARDEFQYAITLTGLTGNTEILEAGLVKLREFLNGHPEKSAAATARFERSHAKFRVHRESYEHFRKYYLRGVEAAEETRNPERWATIASRFAAEALIHGHPRDFVEAVFDWGKAVVQDPATFSILPRQIRRWKSEDARHRKWQATTPDGEDYEHLRIDKDVSISKN